MLYNKHNWILVTCLDNRFICTNMSRVFFNRNVKTFVSDLRQGGGFLLVLWFPP